MTDEDHVKQLTQSSLQEALKFIAPRYGVNPDELLQKLPQFPVNPNEPDQIAAFVGELQVKCGHLTTTEAKVMMVVSRIMIEILQAAMTRKNPPLP